MFRSAVLLSLVALFPLSIESAFAQRPGTAPPSNFVQIDTREGKIYEELKIEVLNAPSSRASVSEHLLSRSVTSLPAGNYANSWWKASKRDYRGQPGQPDALITVDYQNVGAGLEKRTVKVTVWESIYTYPPQRRVKYEYSETTEHSESIRNNVIEHQVKQTKVYKNPHPLTNHSLPEITYKTNERWKDLAHLREEGAPHYHTYMKSVILGTNSDEVFDTISLYEKKVKRFEEPRSGAIVYRPEKHVELIYDRSNINGQLPDIMGDAFALNPDLFYIETNPLQIPRAWSEFRDSQITVNLVHPDIAESFSLNLGFDGFFREYRYELTVGDPVRDPRTRYINTVHALTLDQNTFGGASVGRDVYGEEEQRSPAPPANAIGEIERIQKFKASFSCSRHGCSNARDKIHYLYTRTSAPGDEGTYRQTLLPECKAYATEIAAKIAGWIAEINAHDSADSYLDFVSAAYTLMDIGTEISRLYGQRRLTDMCGFPFGSDHLTEQLREDYGIEIGKDTLLAEAAAVQTNFNSYRNSPGFLSKAWVLINTAIQNIWYNITSWMDGIPTRFPTSEEIAQWVIDSATGRRQ